MTDNPNLTAVSPGGPRFLRETSEVREQCAQALERLAQEVRERTLPLTRTELSEDNDFKELEVAEYPRPFERRLVARTVRIHIDWGGGAS